MAITSGIYIIEHPSGAFYIGATTDIEARWRNHRTRLRNGRHNRALQALVVGDDISAFTIRMLFVAAREHLPMFELRTLNAMKDKPGFSNRFISANRHFPSAETRALMSDAIRGSKRSVRARLRQGETRRAAFASGERTQWNTGRPHPAETRARISAAAKKRYAVGGAPHNKGVPMSDAQKQKLSEAHKARWARKRAEAQWP